MEKKKYINKTFSIKLSDKKYFDLFIGKRITKKQLQGIEGTIPIYSANVFKPIGFHHTYVILNILILIMCFGIDGNFEFNYIKKNIPFLTTDHCGTIRILDERILVEYLLIELEKCKHIYGFDRELRSSLKNMKNIEISLPLLDNGDIDLNTQMSIIEEQFNIIKELKNKIKDYREQIKNLKIEMNNDIKYKQNIKLSQIIDFFTKNK